VGYPIFNLGAIRRDVVWYVRTLEEVMIRASADLGIHARRETGKTGIWVDPQRRSSRPGAQRKEETAEKLAAIGIHISRWVTSHGFAYNVATDLRYFDLIVPCGIADRKATSLEKLLGRRVLPEEIRPLLAKQLCEVFGLTIRTEEPAGLFEKLAEFEPALAVSA
jgi:lipoyl(octanoyl) transferase